MVLYKLSQNSFWDKIITKNVIKYIDKSDIYNTVTYSFLTFYQGVIVSLLKARWFHCIPFQFKPVLFTLQWNWDHSFLDSNLKTNINLSAATWFTERNFSSVNVNAVSGFKISEPNIAIFEFRYTKLFTKQIHFTNNRLPSYTFFYKIIYTYSLKISIFFLFFT